MSLARHVFTPAAMAECAARGHRWMWRRTRHDVVGHDECGNCGETRRCRSDGEVRRDEAIKSRYTAGESIAQLAFDYRLSEERVRGALLDRWVGGRPRAVGPAPEAVEAFLPERIDEVVEKLVENLRPHLTQRQQTAQNKARRAQRDAEIVAAVKAGGNQHEIAARHGIDQSRVAQIVAREKAKASQTLGGASDEGNATEELDQVPALQEPQAAMGEVAPRSARRSGVRSHVC